MTWVDRLLSGTRGELLTLLRAGDRTVTELANLVGLTDNAVRAHLIVLERDGLVEQLPAIPQGVGKPPTRYRSTAAADRLAPRAYAPAMDALLTVLASRMSAGELEALLGDAGRIAGGQPAKGDTRARMEAALALLGRLGGQGELRTDPWLEIRGHSCPLGQLVPTHPEVCKLAEALVTTVVGEPMEEACEKGDRPRCRFRVVGTV